MHKREKETEKDGKGKQRKIYVKRKIKNKLRGR
jgi:hypothetical protein